MSPLTRRIVAVNVLPLALLAVGFLYLGKFESSLIGQQIESLRTQGEIFAGLEPDGIAIIPFDSPHRDRLTAAAAPHASRIVTFGIAKGADVRAIETVRLATGATFVTVQQDGRELSFTMAQPGMHWVSNALAVIACVEAAGADLGLAGLALAELGGNIVDAGRARTAADAAALAGVEGGRQASTRVAAENGATLVAWSSRPDGDGVTVTVEVRIRRAAATASASNRGP